MADEEQPKKSRRGFAALTKEQRTEIARKGGQTSHGGGRKRKEESQDK